jgi:hypothetical protein
LPKKNPKPHKEATGLNNWQKFLTNASTSNQKGKTEVKKHEEYIAIDC